MEPREARGGEGLSCRLCGLPIGRRGTKQQIGAETSHFCCHGCLQVFLLLSSATGVLPEDFQESELYKACLESGIISAPNEGGDEAPADTSLPPLEINCGVEGMWCPSCAWLIEEVLRRTGGVISAKVTFVSDALTLKYLPHLVTPAELAARVKRVGYRLSDSQARGASEKRRLALRLGIASVLTANIMMVSLAVYSGFLPELSQNSLPYFSYPLLAMAGFVLFYAGLPILRRGLTALRYASPTMDSLISLGALSAYIYSAVQVFRGSPHLYFDTASMLITLVLFGRYIEVRARERVSTGIGELRHLASRKVRIEEKGVQRWVGAETIGPGDRFRAFAGDPIPLDSRVLSGTGLIDRSFLTGESRPLAIAPGDLVTGGSVLREGDLLLEPDCQAAESALAHIIATFEAALGRKGSYELLAERASRIFVPAVLFVAIGTGVLLRLNHAPTDTLLLRCLTVLLISCPCALGLAIPLAKVASIDIARRRGILVRDPDCLERLKDVDAMVFDKTGTLTDGDFSLQRIESPEMDEDELLARLAALETGASHFLAREIVREAQERGVPLYTIDGFENLPGLGVRGRVEGEETCVGNRELMERNGLETAPVLHDRAEALGKEGKSIVFFGWAGRVRGFLAFGDPLRKGARKLVDSLRNRSIDLWLTSGDDESTTQAVAARLGIANVLPRALPDDKVNLIKDLQRRGLRVAMVGDGINDAAALAESDVGVAFGAGMNLIREASDITFLVPEPRRLLDALSLSTLSARTARQNLFFAFFYNVIAVPVAAFGLLNPLMAVVAMFASSLTVTANTLRIARSESGRVAVDR